MWFNIKLYSKWKEKDNIWNIACGYIRCCHTIIHGFETCEKERVTVEEARSSESHSACWRVSIKLFSFSDPSFFYPSVEVCIPQGVRLNTWDTVCRIPSSVFRNIVFAQYMSVNLPTFHHLYTYHNLDTNPSLQNIKAGCMHDKLGEKIWIELNMSLRM